MRPPYAKYSQLCLLLLKRQKVKFCFWWAINLIFLHSAAYSSRHYLNDSGYINNASSSEALVDNVSLSVVYYLMRVVRSKQFKDLGLKRALDFLFREAMQTSSSISRKGHKTLLIYLECSLFNKSAMRGF